MGGVTLYMVSPHGRCPFIGGVPINAMSAHGVPL